MCIHMLIYILHLHTSVLGVIVCCYRMGLLSEFRPMISLVLSHAFSCQGAFQDQDCSFPW